MAARQPVVRKCSTPSKPRLHDLLMVGWQRCVARYGRQGFAEALDISTVALDKQLTGSMPDFTLIVAARGFDEDVLNDVLDELGLRLVPKEATCDIDDLGVTMAKALVKLNEAKHPDSPGGRSITHTEFLAAEAIMRDVNKASGRWLDVCAEIRRPRSVA